MIKLVPSAIISAVILGAIATLSDGIEAGLQCAFIGVLAGPLLMVTFNLKWNIKTHKYKLKL